MKNFFFFFLFILAIGIIAFLGYSGFLSGTAKIFGADKPRDLEVIFNADSLESANNKTKVRLENSFEILAIPEGISVFGSHPVSTVFTSEELTSLFGNSKWVYYPFSDVQIKINDDGTIEISGILLTGRINGFIMATGGLKEKVPWFIKKLEWPFFNPPFYFRGTLGIENNKVNLVIDQAMLGKFTLPARLVKKYRQPLENFITERISFLEGLFVFTLSFSDAGMDFSGELPNRIIFLSSFQ